jgi:uncharacterized protein YlxW (UPF0749 family)
MARGAKRARALIALAVGVLAFLGTADAQTRTASQVERDRRAETARAERLRAEANTARDEVRQLDTRLTEAGARRRDAEAAATARLFNAPVMHKWSSSPANVSIFGNPNITLSDAAWYGGRLPSHAPQIACKPA